MQRLEVRLERTHHRILIRLLVVIHKRLRKENIFGCQ